MAVVGINLPLHAGVAGTYLIYLRSAGVLLNTGGDTLTESAGGYFTGTVAESFVADAYSALVTFNGTPIYSGWLEPSQSLIVDLPTLASALAAINTATLAAAMRQRYVS